MGLDKNYMGSIRPVKVFCFSNLPLLRGHSCVQGPFLGLMLAPERDRLPRRAGGRGLRFRVWGAACNNYYLKGKGNLVSRLIIGIVRVLYGLYVLGTSCTY